jgi:hypothetical protein
MKAMRVDPVGSLGASVGQITVKPASLPFTDEFVDAGRGIMSDTEIAPLLPWSLAMPPPGVPRRVTIAVIRQVAPSCALMRGHKPCCDR